jgi:hypothetical protein
VAVSCRFPEDLGAADDAEKAAPAGEILLQLPPYFAGALKNHV